MQEVDLIKIVIIYLEEIYIKYIEHRPLSNISLHLYFILMLPLLPSRFGSRRSAETFSINHKIEIAKGGFWSVIDQVVKMCLVQLFQKDQK